LISDEAIKFNDDDDRSTLSILNAKPSDSGKYTCKPAQLEQVPTASKLSVSVADGVAKIS
jgi:hypothetical protein